MENLSYKYRFTLFTPCFCSAKFIDRIKETIDKQTFRDFEWIVVNDASTDNTSELLQAYIKTLDIPVKFFDLKKNQMLAANYNLAVENAEGEIFVVLGHDDIYLPDMLETYNNLYEQYNSDKICGIVARCETQYGKVTPKEFTKPIMNYWEYGVDHNGNGTGEAPRALKTGVLKRYIPFDAEAKLNPLVEGMMGCDGYDFITTDKIDRKYFVFENELSLTNNIVKYTKWCWTQALRDMNLFSQYYHCSVFNRINKCVGYATSSIYYNLSFRDAIAALKHYRTLVILLYPVAKVKVALRNNNTIYSLYHRIVLRRERGKTNK